MSDHKQKVVVMAGWDDVPHLTDEAKAKMLAGTPPHLRDSRSKGIPSLGAGAIYPIPEEDILCDPMEIPAWWRRSYGMDVGWNNTAAVWGSWDVDNDIVYIYSEHKMGEEKPLVHAASIKARGEWIWGEIDPAARGRQQGDG